MNKMEYKSRSSDLSKNPNIKSRTTVKHVPIMAALPHWSINVNP